MLPYNIVLKDKPELARYRRKLEKEKTRLLEELRENKEVEQDIGIIYRQLALIREAVREAVEELETLAPFVATTVAKLSLSKHLRTRSFDVVVVDEASMVNIPAVFMTMTLAQRHGVVAGDFLQLQPIYQCQKGAVPRWLGRSVFNSTEIREQAMERKTDPRLVVLKRQYRMTDEISALINSLFYGGILENAPIGERDVFSAKSLLFEEPLILVDTSGIGNCVREANSNSRLNVNTAAYSANLAKVIAKSNVSIGIITPYRAQAKEIKKILEAEQLEDAVSVSTVHKFQGSEKDVIIFDFTDSFPQRRPSVLTSGSKEGFYANKSQTLPLINVALSRAKSQLIVLADVNFFKEKLTNTSTALTTIRHLEANGAYLKGATQELRLARRASLEFASTRQKNVTEEGTYNSSKAFQQLSCTKCGNATNLRLGPYGYYFHCPSCRQNRSLTDESLGIFLSLYQPKCPNCEGIIWGEMVRREPRLRCIECGKQFLRAEVSKVLQR